MISFVYRPAIFRLSFLSFSTALRKRSSVLCSYHPFSLSFPPPQAVSTSACDATEELNKEGHTEDANQDPSDIGAPRAWPVPLVPDASDGLVLSSLLGASSSLYSLTGPMMEDSNKEARVKLEEELEAGFVSAAPPVLVEGPLLQSHLEALEDQ